MNPSAFLHLVFAQGLLVASASLPAVIQNPPIIINETISMAKGIYTRASGVDDLKPGEVIAMPMNEPAKDYLGAKLGYPKDTLLIKRVAAVPGDIVCRHDNSVTVKAQTVRAARADAHGNLLPVWEGCHTLLRGEVFLLGDHPGSFDSRYFGPVTKSELSGTYQAVMTW